MCTRTGIGIGFGALKAVFASEEQLAEIANVINTATVRNTFVLYTPLGRR